MAVEYKPSAESQLWKVERDEWILSQFGVIPDKLPEFHQIASKCGTGWEIVRLYACINPAIVPVDTDSRYLRPQSKVEIVVHLGIDKNQFASGLNTVRASWLAWCRAQQRSKDLPPEDFKAPASKHTGRPPGSKSKKKSSEPVMPPSPLEHAQLPTVSIADVAPELEQPRSKKKAAETYVPPPTVEVPPIDDEAQADLMRRYGFPDSMFGANASTQEAVDERNWALGKIKDYQRLLDEPAVSTMVQHAIVNELLLNRINRQLLATGVATMRFAELQDVKKLIEDNYQDAWTAINKICPWADQVTNRVNQAGVISDFIRAIQDYKVKKSNARVFGLFSSFGLQIRLRESLQAETRYRPGQAAALLEAMQPDALWDPDWRRSLPDYACKLMDETHREIARRLRESSGVPITDLESDHPTAGEYPPLYEPKESPAESLVEPLENVPLGE